MGGVPAPSAEAVTVSVLFPAACAGGRSHGHAFRRAGRSGETRADRPRQERCGLERCGAEDNPLERGPPNLGVGLILRGLRFSPQLLGQLLGRRE